MRSRTTLAVLAILVCFFGCRSEAEKTVPNALIGVWKTSVHGYEENFLELRKDEILFGAGESEFSVNTVFQVETSHVPLERTTLITIHYTDENGKDNTCAIYYDPRRPNCLRLKHQMGIEWTLVEPRPAQRVSPASRRLPGRGRTGTDLSVVVALLGVALTAGAALWRRRELRAEAVAFAESLRGRRKSILVGIAGSADEPQPPTTLPPVVEKEKRRSERILLKVPLLVAGFDVYGKSFREDTFTLSISRNGAFIWLKNSARQGDTIAVSNLRTHQSCLFRLCDSDKDPSGEFTAWGIECLERNANFWQIRFPEQTPTPSTRKKIIALILCGACHSREVAELTPVEYYTMLKEEFTKRYCADCGATTEWKFILVEGAPGAVPQGVSATLPPSGEEKRREKRILAKLPIRLTHPEDGRAEDTLTENVSKSGVCCAASMELNAGEVIRLTFDPGVATDEDQILARIMWRRSMGQNRKNLYGIRLYRKGS
jgi:hypothetical protein